MDLPDRADQRVLVGTSASLTATFRDGTGELVVPAGPVTCTVTDSAGVVVLASGAATIAATGICTRSLPPASNSKLDYLAVVWVDTATGQTVTTHVDVAGGFYFSVAEARASDATLTDETKYPTADIIFARREVEDEFERICDVAFVPRYAVETIPAGRQRVSPGNGGPALLLSHPLPRKVRTLSYYTTPGTATVYGASDLALLSLEQPDRLVAQSIPSGSVTVGYEHGYDRPAFELVASALTRLRVRLNYNKSGIPDRASNFAVADGGTYALTTADFGHVGLPNIDADLSRYSMRHSPVGG